MMWNLSLDQVNQIAQAYQMPIAPGDYWYDGKTGAWGIKCGPAVGLGIANLEMGGKLKADASCGNTHVFVNGRELHQLELMNLQMLAGIIAPGHYWMDAELNAGREGGPALVNYKQLMAQRQTQMNGMQEQAAVVIISGTHDSEQVIPVRMDRRDTSVYLVTDLSVMAIEYEIDTAKLETTKSKRSATPGVLFTYNQDSPHLGYGESYLSRPRINQHRSS